MFNGGRKYRDIFFDINVDPFIFNCIKVAMKLTHPVAWQLIALRCSRASGGGGVNQTHTSNPFATTRRLL